MIFNQFLAGRKTKWISRLFTNDSFEKKVFRMKSKVSSFVAVKKNTGTNALFPCFRYDYNLVAHTKVII